MLLLLPAIQPNILEKKSFWCFNSKANTWKGRIDKFWMDSFLVFNNKEKIFRCQCIKSYVGKLTRINVCYYCDELSEMWEWILVLEHNSGKEPRQVNTKSGTRESVGFLPGFAAQGGSLDLSRQNLLFLFLPLSFLSADQGRDKAAGEMQRGWTRAVWNAGRKFENTQMSQHEIF